MHLIFLFLQLYVLPVMDCSLAANSFNMVELLLMLLQVTWPTFTAVDHCNEKLNA
jgi:hypothetical protein